MMFHTFTRSLPCGSLALLGLAMTLLAPMHDASAQDRTRPHVVTRDGPVAEADTPSTVQRLPIDTNRPEGPQLIRRQIVEPAAVVSRALSEQPVLPHLAEVRVGGVTVLVDPQVDYRRPTGGIDKNHTIIRAQRLHQAAQPASPARVVRHHHADQPDPSATTRPTPRAIFLRPAPPQQQPPADDRDDLLVQSE
ncbi:hypothetical protein ACERK3_16415 [Phycisphaerales bacterium AB-hyl4]|uniref:Secreted protein n=1 Tax=Natronomicrosphaera hydrolytica TaxID=3242702 RepID=A0ABV4UA28_9BACT